MAAVVEAVLAAFGGGEAGEGGEAGGEEEGELNHFFFFFLLLVEVEVEAQADPEPQYCCTTTPHAGLVLSTEQVFFTSRAIFTLKSGSIHNYHEIKSHVVGNLLVWTQDAIPHNSTTC